MHIEHMIIQNHCNKVKQMFILIIKIINIYKFKVSKVILWLFSTYVARILHCLHYHGFTLKQAMDL